MGSLWISHTSYGAPGLVDLIGAKTSLLIDDHAVLTGPNPLFRLDGFEYDGISPSSPQDVNTRLKWINRQPPYNPQPFDQLAAVFRRNGQERKATKVLVHKRRARRRILEAWWSKRWDEFLDLSVLYGWQAWRPLVVGFVLFLYVFGLLICVQSAGLISRSEDTVSAYHPLIHALDIFVPIVDLGIESNWGVNTVAGGSLAWLVLAYLWLLKLVGWGTVTLALAALTGIVKRE